MALHEVTYYQAKCDKCGDVCDKYEDGGTARKRAVIAARSAAASERDLKKSADIAGKVIHAADIMQRYDSGGVSI